MSAGHDQGEKGKKTRCVAITGITVQRNMRGTSNDICICGNMI